MDAKTTSPFPRRSPPSSRCPPTGRIFPGPPFSPSLSISLAAPVSRSFKTIERSLYSRATRASPSKFDHLRPRSEVRWRLEDFNFASRPVSSFSCFFDYEVVLAFARVGSMPALLWLTSFQHPSPYACSPDPSMK